MEFAKVQVNRVTARTFGKQVIPAGVVGGTITVEYTDVIWADLTKTVVFRREDMTRDVVTNDSIVTIPAEIVATPCDKIQIGFYGTSENFVLPTIWTTLGEAVDAADPSGDESTDPELPVWAQLAERVEDLEESGTGKPGEDGEDGFSPVAKVEQTEAGAVISITDKKGTTTATITNGKDGKDGDDGQDGYTPQKGVDYRDGADGKSAYAYAKEGGFAGTEEEFAAKLAKEYPQPDWNAAKGEPGHVLNRTHYSEFTESNAIVPETVVTFTADTGFGGMLQPTTAPVIGNTYKVVWDGVEYIRECSDYNGMPCIGNFVYAGSGFEDMDSGEPFFMVYMDGMLMCLSDFMYTATEGSATVSIVEGIYKVVPIASQYLSEMKPLYLELSGTELVTPTIIAIQKAFKMGRQIIAKIQGINTYYASLLSTQNDELYFARFDNGIQLYTLTPDGDYYTWSVKTIVQP